MQDIHKQLLAYQIWLSLTPNVRHNLVILFDIPKSGHTVVEYRAGGNVVTSDGYTPGDLWAITTEKMQSILHSDSTDFYGMFEQVVDNLDALVGGTFASEGSRLSHSTAASPQRVPEKGEVATTPQETEPTPRLMSWPEFVKMSAGKGKTKQEVAADYKNYKDGHDQKGTL